MYVTINMVGVLGWYFNMFGVTVRWSEYYVMACGKTCFYSENRLFE
jgi:hypothetical protein